MTRTLGAILLTTTAALSLSACATNGTMATEDTAAEPVAVSNTTATKNPVVGGAEMYPSYTIVQNASNASNLTTLVAAVKAAGLVDTLNSAGPFTVFAPQDSAFDRLPAGTLDTLLKPENKATLTKILTNHVVAGDVSAATLLGKIKADGGKTMVKTVAGDMLTFSLVNGDVAITDANGTTSYVQMADVKQKNGVVHTINGVLLPKM